MALPGIATIDTYGGALNDYAPVEDATTDRPAAGVNPLVVDVAGMTQTAVRAWVRFTAAATTGAMVLVAHAAVWGNDNSVAPTLGRTSTGLFTLSWPATVTDAIPNDKPGAGSARAVALRGGSANVQGSALYFPIVTTNGSNIATVRVFNTSFALNDAVGVSLDVFVL